MIYEGEISLQSVEIAEIATVRSRGRHMYVRGEDCRGIHLVLSCGWVVVELMDESLAWFPPGNVIRAIEIPDRAIG